MCASTARELTGLVGGSETPSPGEHWGHTCAWPHWRGSVGVCELWGLLWVLRVPGWHIQSQAAAFSACEGGGHSNALTASPGSCSAVMHPARGGVTIYPEQCHICPDTVTQLPGWGELPGQEEAAPELCFRCQSPLRAAEHLREQNPSQPTCLTPGQATSPADILVCCFISFFLFFSLFFFPPFLNLIFLFSEAISGGQEGEPAGHQGRHETKVLQLPPQPLHWEHRKL